jgi:hypothetical protein
MRRKGHLSEKAMQHGHSETEKTWSNSARAGTPKAESLNLRPEGARGDRQAHIARIASSPAVFAT